MRHARLTAASVLSLVLGLSATASTVTAQEADADHPAVGTWAAPSAGVYVMFVPGGGAIGTDMLGGVVFGNWQASGERTADLTVRGPYREPGAEPGTTEIVRAVVDVAQDESTASLTATVEQLTPDGVSTGPVGPVSVTLERLGVEPMGEPIGALPDTMPGATPSPGG